MSTNPSISANRVRGFTGGGGEVPPSAPAFNSRRDLGYNTLKDPQYNFTPTPAGASGSQLTDLAAQNTAGFNQALADTGGYGLLGVPDTFELNPVTISALSSFTCHGVPGTYGGARSRMLLRGFITDTPHITLASPDMKLEGIHLSNRNLNVQAGGHGFYHNALQMHPSLGVQVGSSIFANLFSADGYDICANFNNTFESSITNFRLTNARSAHMRMASELLPDGGDTHVLRGQIGGARYPGAIGILQNSAGGLVVDFVKFNGGNQMSDCFQYNGDYSKAANNPNVLRGTSILTIGAGVSMENFNRYGVWVRTALELVKISPFEICGYGAQASAAIRLDDCFRGYIGGITIKKAEKDLYTKLAQLNRCDKMTIAPSNTWDFGPAVADGYEFNSCTNYRLV